MAFRGSWAYHKSCPLGRIFKDEDEYLSHLAVGWVEAPWLIDEPFAVPVVIAQEPVQEPEPRESVKSIRIGAKKPGRPSKKVKGGK